MAAFKNYYFRYIKSVLVALIALALSVMLIVVSITSIVKNLKNVNEPSAENSPTPSEEQTVKTNRVKIQLAGDVVLNNVFLANCADENGEYNFDSCFSEIYSQLDGDLVVYNLEGLLNAVGDGTGIGGAPLYNYPMEIGISLKKAGFNTCVTANDRAYYYGDAGVENNLANLRSLGYTTFGTSLESEKNYIVKDYNGIKIALLAYADVEDNNVILNDMVSAMDLDDTEGAINRIQDDILNVKALGAEIIIASMHWGKEMDANPSQQQRALADRMINAGVDIVYGTLSHVFQPVTYKNIVTDQGESKNVIVAYSMGNFLSHPTVTSGQTSQESAVLNVYVERDSQGKAYISATECLPIYIYARALDDSDIKFSYQILHSTEYVSQTERPQLFKDDADWLKCKNAYNNIKEIIDKSAENGLLLGLK